MGENLKSASKHKEINGYFSPYCDVNQTKLQFVKSFLGLLNSWNAVTYGKGKKRPTSHSTGKLRYSNPVTPSLVEIAYSPMFSGDLPCQRCG